ncbi:MAG TPA: cytochrome c [Candidatus Paceibacterota bacterium]|nr:cytochrome c [Verrucomicrobiota bacterium]HRY47498.1 cytochrome c [Candidatus Paceibacterota bacterium]HSA00610.1 cytochrome c [Candidatus Paceibacterota bacterium]
MTQKRFFAGAMLVLAGVLPTTVQPQEGHLSATNSTLTAGSTPSASSEAAQNKSDPIAGRFAVMCSGCHSLTGAKLNGPDLSPSTGWPMDQLKPAIKRMEKNVGPLTDEQVTAFAEFLKAPDIRERLKTEQERIQAQFMAKLAPPDPLIGKALFLGTQPLRNGGLACAACHAAAGAGGNLGKDLTGVFVRMGRETPLISAIEQSGFKIMAPHYQRHPVTQQEAMHLARYFSTLDPKQPAPSQASFTHAGAGLALALFVGLAFSLRKQRQQRGRDQKLQRRRK